MTFDSNTSRSPSSYVSGSPTVYGSVKPLHQALLLLLKAPLQTLFSHRTNFTSLASGRNSTDETFSCHLGRLNKVLRSGLQHWPSWTSTPQLREPEAGWTCLCLYQQSIESSAKPCQSEWLKTRQTQISQSRWRLRQRYHLLVEHSPACPSPKPSISSVCQHMIGWVGSHHRLPVYNDCFGLHPTHSNIALNHHHIILTKSVLLLSLTMCTSSFNSNKKVAAKLQRAESCFEKACDQIKILNTKLSDLRQKYERASTLGQRAFRYSLQLRIATAEGLRDTYCMFASNMAARVSKLRKKLYPQVERLRRWNDGPPEKKWPAWDEY